jgi:hypothetical protein
MTEQGRAGAPEQQVLAMNAVRTPAEIASRMDI